MTAPLVLAVLAGTIIVLVGGRMVVRHWNTPGTSDIVPGGKGGALILLGALVVIIATPPMLDHLFPEESASSLASEPTPPASPSGFSPEPSTAASPSPGAQSAPSPSPAAASPSPAPALAAPAAAPSSTVRATRRRTTSTGGSPTAPPSAATSPAPSPAAPATSPSVPAGPSTSAPPATPAPPASPSPKAPAVTPAPLAPAWAVTVTCSGLDATMERRDEFTVTYDIDSPTARKVGVGVLILDPEGDDHSNGSGDDNSVPLEAGHSTITRTVTVPRSLGKRTFGVVGRVWPEDHVGDAGATSLGEGSCGSFLVTG